MSNEILKPQVEVPESQEEELQDEYENSAIFLMEASDRFRKLTYALADRKKRAVTRVLEAVLFEPLEEVELVGKEEKQLFDICQAIMYHKGKMLEYAVKRTELKKQGAISGE